MKITVHNEIFVFDLSKMLKIMNIHFIFLLQQGLTEPEFYGNLVYKLKKIVGTNNFSA